MSPAPDLHTHSTASDGTLSPSVLVARAASAGIQMLALTDHDTTAGMAEAADAARQAGVTLIPGVEVSVSWGGRTIHIVGLGVDVADEGLCTGLAGLRQTRHWRAEEIGRRLARHGIADACEGARRLSGGQLLGRMHFARLLVERGVAENPRVVFKHYLTVGKPGHVKVQWATLAEALGWIHGAGGQAVIAHPARYRLTRTRLLHLIGEFRQLGGAGIEVVTGSHSRDDIFRFAQLAREQRLLASCGSDYHGPGDKRFELGCLPRLPDGCKPIWHNWPCARDTFLATAAPRTACA